MYVKKNQQQQREDKKHRKLSSTTSLLETKKQNHNHNDKHNRSLSSPTTTTKQSSSSKSTTKTSQSMKNRQEKNLVNGTSTTSSSSYRKNRSSPSMSQCSNSTITSSSSLKRKHQSSSIIQKQQSKKHQQQHRFNHQTNTNRLTNHNHNHHFNNKILKNTEKSKSSSSSSTSTSSSVVQKLKNSNYKIPKNRSSSSTNQSGDSSTKLSPKKCTIKTETIFDSNDDDDSNLIDSDGDDDKNIDSSDMKTINKQSTTKTTKKNINGRSKTFLKAKQFVETNEKLYQELRKFNRPREEYDEIESLKIHFNSTQWSLEDRLSSIVKQESDLKLESKLFQSWLRDECGQTNNRSNSGCGRNRKTTFHSVSELNLVIKLNLLIDFFIEKFQKYYKKRRDQERWKQHNLRGWPLNGSIYISSASLSKRHWYYEKLKLKDEFLPPLDTALLLPTPSPSTSSSSSLCTVKTDEMNDDLDDGSHNWELVSLEHAFNAFPLTFQTTNPKVKSLSSSSANICDEITTISNESTFNRSEKLSSSTNIHHRKTTAGLKKKSKKIRKKNRTANNARSTKAVQQQQLASQSTNVNESSIIAASQDSSSEYMTLFSMEKWEKFQTFIQRIVLNIERRNWEPLQSYLRFAINDFVRFDLLINHDLQTIWSIIATIKYESEPIIEPENMPLPAKRRRRSSSKVLEYSFMDSNSLSSSSLSRKRNRLNGMISNNDESFRNGSKSPTPPPSCINKSSTLSPVTFHMPLMTRTQSKYFFENVINGGSGGNSTPPPVTTTTTFKNAQQLQQYLMERVISMESLQKLSHDIHQRHSVLKILKIFDEFFSSKFKSSYQSLNNHVINNSTESSSTMETAIGSSPNINMATSKSTKTTYRIYNGKRRRRKRSLVISSVESSMTSQQQCSNRKNGKNSIQNHHQHPQCHGVECSIKFDMPNISRIDMDQPSSSSIQEFDNNNDFLDPNEYLFDGTMELLKQTEQMFANTTGNSFFPKSNLFNGNDACGTGGESSSCSESRSYSQCNSPRRLWQQSTSNNRSNNNNISPSKCEMKLRSRSSSSSSNSIQFGSLDESSQDRDHHNNREHSTFMTWESNNSTIFKNFIDINFDEIESPTIANNQINDKTRMMIRTRGGSKRLAAAAAAAAAAEKESNRIDESNHHDNQNNKSKYLAIIIEQIENQLRLLSAKNQSRLSAICDMFCQDYHLDQLEYRLERLDFEIIDLYHQYLFNEKKFTDEELESCLSRLEDHSQLNNEYLIKSLYLMTLAPNSQHMTLAFCQQSKLMSTLMSKMMMNNQCSMFKDLFESIMMTITTGRNHQQQQSTSLSSSLSISNIQQELWKLSKHIDWSLLDNNNINECNDYKIDDGHDIEDNDGGGHNCNESLSSIKRKLSFDEIAKNIVIAHVNDHNNHHAVDGMDNLIAESSTSTLSSNNNNDLLDNYCLH